MLGREAHTFYSDILVWEMQEGKKNPSTLKKRSDYYGFGLTMPGRSSNSANPNDKYKFIGEELDDEAGINLMNLNARMYDPTIARFMQVDPLFDAPEQLGLSPYNYSWNDPVNLSDPTGECPACWGAVIGGGVNFIAQVASGVASGQTVGESIRNVDYLDVAIATGTGALTGGASAFTTKVAANVAEGYLTETFDGDKNTIISMNSNADYDIVDAGIDAFVGGAASKFEDLGKAVAQNSDQVSSLNRAAGRAERIASTGAPRAGQTRRATTAREAANNYGSGRTAQTISATGQAATTGVLNATGNSNTRSPQNNRFMYRPYVARQDQTRVQLPNN